MGLRRNKKLKTRLAGSQPVRGGIQAPGACGGLLGAWGPGCQGLGPGLSGFPTKTTKPRRFFANLLRRRGCRLKRLLRRWGPGGKRSRDTPPTPPPRILGLSKKGRRFSPSPPSATIQHAPQGRRTVRKSESAHFSAMSPKHKVGK